MKLLEQYNYRTPTAWRPQIHLMSEETIGFYSASFSWGEMELGEKAFENVRIFVEAALNQSEVTNPFGINESLSSLENALLSGCSLANSVIYRLINGSSLSSGVEGLWMVKQSKELAMAHIGQPQVYLFRENHIIPLFAATDLMTQSLNHRSFLPNKMLGLFAHTHMNIQSLSIEKGDQLILLAHSFAPKGLFEPIPSKQTLDLKMIYNKIVQEYSHCPFWISRFQVL